MTDPVAVRCSECGTSLEDPVRACPHCGTASPVARTAEGLFLATPTGVPAGTVTERHPRSGLGATARAEMA